MADQPSIKLPSSETVEKILRTVEGTDVESIDLRWGDVHVRVRQDAHRAVMIPTDTVETEPTNTIPVLAPLTGIYYGRPAPEQAPFVQEGSIVACGQVVGLIETMKLFNEILAEVEGSVAEILVREGDLVEANQPLMRILPQAHGEPA